MHHFLLKNMEKMEESSAGLLNERIQIVGNLMSS